MSEVYVDANASEPLRPEARDAILATLALGPGNASSPHAAGRRLRKALGDAREQVAALAGAQASEIVFTSGATESNALAILGALAARPGALVTTHAEHSSVARIADRLEAGGCDVRRAGVNRWGRFDAGEVVRLAADATLVSAVLAQSVTGALEPVSELTGRLGGAALHVDAAQAAGRVAVDASTHGAAFVSLSAHKLGGPQGIGALVIREGAAWRHPAADGAQERGRRAGTEAVALAAGFGAAADAVRASRDAEALRAGEMVRRLREFVETLPGAHCLTPPERALPNTLLCAFDGCPGDAVMAALDQHGFRVSTGTACASGARLPPEVLVAGGATPAEAARAVRISVSWANRDDEILALCLALPAVLSRARRAAATS